ncbi:phosphomethylpyrimidine kinase [Chloroherpeton thalassium ATCC 35110]|uniref:hydroxymethylpyrimidine kinase n=1 Tax=Chloroherpeton thalassium (strain ATCC 35110 / GB-78) TaxID=517418 RepID=B3QUZ2_CHLT3|nr:bifunctional hydroxymethylpyrimidine kinase/phosphomethylpyrimidine kinase [Chloroherpeton thalassium]ACF14493.1 phosphomethylpyrimidine kinase [Chloroherpeton thalassium ATCC 35110]
MPKTYTKILTIAGSDSGGGAGVQADIKTFSALGCYAMSVITALTAQNTVRVSGIFPVPAAFVAKQIDAIFEDIGADAVKIGMLNDAAIIRAVAERLKAHHAKNIVLDPVMVAKSGDKLLQSEAINALKSELFPIVKLLTPNLPEAEVLLGGEILTRKDMEDAAKALKMFGARAVLVKGGHSNETTCADCLLSDDQRIHWFENPRIETENTHGTGCTLSSAIAAYMGKGQTIKDAVASAKAYISEAIQAGKDYRLGNGHGPVRHFYKFWE